MLCFMKICWVCLSELFQVCVFWMWIIIFFFVPLVMLALLLVELHLGRFSVFQCCMGPWFCWLIVLAFLLFRCIALCFLPSSIFVDNVYRFDMSDSELLFTECMMLWSVLCVGVFLFECFWWVCVRHLVVYHIVF